MPPELTLGEQHPGDDANLGAVSGGGFDHRACTSENEMQISITSMSTIKDFVLFVFSRKYPLGKLEICQNQTTISVVSPSWNGIPCIRAHSGTIPSFFFNKYLGLYRRISRIDPRQ
jgi:hypothetical protein